MLYFPEGSWKAEISSSLISDLGRKCCSVTDTVSRWSLGAPHTCAGARGTAGWTGPMIPSASCDRNAQRCHRHSPAVVIDHVPHRCPCDSDLSPHPGHELLGTRRPVQEHRCFTRCSRGLSPSAGHRVAPVPPGSAASKRSGHASQQRTTWNGNPFVPAPRGRSHPVPAGGARLRYRRRALGPGTGRGSSASGARLGRAGPGSRRVLAGAAAQQAEPAPVRYGREKGAPGPGSVGAAPPVSNSQSQQLGLAR